MIERFLQVIEDELGDMFGGGVEIGKGLHFVEVAMIEFVYYLLYMRLQDFEIDAHAQLIEFMGTYGYSYFPIVAMGKFAASRVISEMMTTGEMGFDKNIVHGSYL